MRLPPVLMLTDRHQLPSGRSLTEQVRRSVDAGVRAVVLRERDLDDRERTELASELAAVLEAVGGHLIAAAPRVDGAHGTHLRAGDAADALTHPPAGVVGRSCHDARELAQARRERVDFVVLGPVAASASKPGYGPALGPRGLAELIRPHRPTPRDASVPPTVYALGGVDAGNAATWLRAGADGVAVMGALMRAGDPASVAADLVAAVSAGSRA